MCIFVIFISSSIGTYEAKAVVVETAVVYGTLALLAMFGITFAVTQMQTSADIERGIGALLQDPVLRAAVGTMIYDGMLNITPEGYALVQAIIGDATILGMSMIIPDWAINEVVSVNTLFVTENNVYYLGSSTDYARLYAGESLVLDAYSYDAQTTEHFGPEEIQVHNMTAKYILTFDGTNAKVMRYITNANGNPVSISQTNNFSYFDVMTDSTGTSYINFKLYMQEKYGTSLKLKLYSSQYNSDINLWLPSTPHTTALSVSDVVCGNCQLGGYFTRSDNLEQMLYDLDMSQYNIETIPVEGVESLIGSYGDTDTGVISVPIPTSIPKSYSDVLTSDMVDSLVDEGIITGDGILAGDKAQNTNKFKLPNFIVTKFPFCIPFDMYTAFALLRSEAVVPSFTIPFELGDWFSYDITISLARFSGVVAIFRWFQLLAFCFFLMKVTKQLIGW